MSPTMEDLGSDLIQSIMNEYCLRKTTDLAHLNELIVFVLTDE